MSAVAAMLDSLTGMSLHGLRMEWGRYHSSDAPAAMSRELLQRAIGFKMQEEVLGGLSRRAQLRLRSLRSATGKGRAASVDRAASNLKPGTKLLREWQGKVHEVLALEDGQFAYAGRSYRSLTTIAREITGAHWSGPRFFGLTVGGLPANG